MQTIADQERRYGVRLSGEWCGRPNLAEQMHDPTVEYVKGRRIREERLKKREREREREKVESEKEK